LQLFEMARAQVVVDVLEGLLGQQAQAFRLDHQHLFAVEFRCLDVIGGQLAIGRLVFPRREQGAVMIGGRA
jgi:hypothetical protein